MEKLRFIIEEDGDAVIVNKLRAGDTTRRRVSIYDVKGLGSLMQEITEVLHQLQQLQAKNIEKESTDGNIA